MDLQSRIRAFASWLKAHEDELRADPEGIQEGTALLDSAVSGECVVQDDVLHVILPQIHCGIMCSRSWISMQRTFSCTAAEIR